MYALPGRNPVCVEFNFASSDIFIDPLKSYGPSNLEFPAIFDYSVKTAKNSKSNAH